MKLNWLRPGTLLRPGLEEASLTIEWTPLIPVSALFGDPQPHEGDGGEAERMWLLEHVDELVTKSIEEDRYTRQAIMLNCYPGKFPKNCLSLFHFTVRPFAGVDTLNLFTHIRSVAVPHLGYDLITIDKVYQRVYESFKHHVDERYREREVIQVGVIQTHIESLHYYQGGSHGL